MSNPTLGPSDAAVPWKTFLALTAVIIGCSFEHGVIVQQDGGQNNAYEFDCLCSPDPVTQTFSIAASPDDAEEFIGSGIINLASTDLEFVLEDGVSPQLVGLRFAALGIPQGATVLSANIQFTVDETTNTPTSLEIRAQASDDAPTFTAANGNISGRALGTVMVPWAPPAWNVLNEAGPAQQTPDLAPILQELVDRPGWTQESAAVFIFSGTGHRAAWAFDRSPANAPRLTVQYQEPAVELKGLSACVPVLLNPNLDGGHVPTDAELGADLVDRVQPTLSGLAAACGYPSHCACMLGTARRFAPNCDEPCVEVPLEPMCTNFNPLDGGVTATNADGGTPVCTPHSPLSAILFGQRSRCEVSGTVTVEVEGEDTKMPATTGVVHLVGRPCPGQSCAVKMEYALDLDPVTYSSLFGSATFSDLMSVGTSVPGGEAVLDAAGNGAFGPSTIDFGARGRRGSDVRKVVGTNDDVLDVGVVWAGPAPVCELSGSMIGNSDPELRRCEPAGPNANAICTTDADCEDAPECTDEVCNCLPVPETELALSLDVSGPLVNQPPTANAGLDQVVECNTAGGARFELVSLSTDPDGNLALARWHLGGRAGPVVGFAPRSTVQQAVGVGTEYVLRVIDALAQTDEDGVQVQVVDTTPPLLSCNAPDTVAAGSHNLSFTATAEDVCDPGATPVVTAYRCEKNGKSQPCKVTFAGDTVTVINPSGVGTRISWDVRVADASGNLTARTCSVDVTPQ